MSICICPNCGYMNECDEILCVRCGAPLRETLREDLDDPSNLAERTPLKFIGFKCGRYEKGIEIGVEIDEEKLLELVLEDRSFRKFLFYLNVARARICHECEDFRDCEYPCERIAEFIQERAPDLVLKDDPKQSEE